MQPPRLIAALLFIVIGCTAQADYQIEEVVDGLDYPWSVAFLPQGDLLVAELAGNLRRISNGEVSTPIANVPDVFRLSQGGLFDVLLDPDFHDNATLYLSYAAGDIDENATTVVQARLSGDSLEEVTSLFEATPKKSGPLHYGGRLAFMATGELLLTVGDGSDYREAAQDPAGHLGKTILLARGQPPVIFTSGHRNAQGLAVSKKGTIFLHEHGPRGGDEVNLIESGKNYGWPLATYGMDYHGARISPFKELPNLENGIHIWVPSIAPSGLMIYEGSMFPEWQGDLFVGALLDEEVRRLDMDGNRVVSEESVFPEISARIRDIREAPDGSIYVVTDGNPGRILRVFR